MSIQVLAGVALMLGAGGVVLAGRREPVSVASERLRRGLPEVEPVAPEPAAPSALVTSVAAASRRITPDVAIRSLETRVAAAGLQGTWSLDSVFALKLVLGAVGALIGFSRISSSPTPASFLMAAVLVVGTWYLPDFMASQRADERRRQLQRELPDTMDQLTIAVEAGLGFEAAMARIAKQGDGPLAAELRRTLQDIQLGVNRADALDALAERTDVTDLRRFVAATRQAERYGLPIANVLRTQAAELRDKRRQRAEEHAMKIPVKVLFPLVLCILPTLFIVILGPGAVRLIQGGGLGG